METVIGNFLKQPNRDFPLDCDTLATPAEQHRIGSRHRQHSRRQGDSLRVRTERQRHPTRPRLCVCTHHSLPAGRSALLGRAVTYPGHVCKDHRRDSQRPRLRVSPSLHQAHVGTGRGQRELQMDRLRKTPEPLPNSTHR